ncbi:MAG: HAD family phosphatase [Prevotella sp.]|jgi:putative hydrolase of the HAD superfamily|nr:HAD family phosphatase [Prevotella sp.]MCI2086688.1 HAD family phosphatase [Prevotella sp.]MCI2124488.1 HAD family phosphatase [Prevotella sp.]
MIKNIIFDLGGIIFTIDEKQAVRRFKEIGLKNADEQLDPYRQSGYFGELELGKISAEEFRQELSTNIGHTVTLDDCRYAWTGYVKEVPQINLDKLISLREKGYRLILLTNTNPFMMSWAESNEFDGKGHPLSYYFDAAYKSYQMKLMKPDKSCFLYLLRHEKIAPEESLFIDDGPRNVAAAGALGLRTYCPENGLDWTKQMDDYLK